MKTAATSVLSLGLLIASAAAQSGAGTLFNFVPGLGACGFTNTSDQFVASVSNTTFHSFPGAGANPNANPICTHNLTVSFNGTNVTAQIVDFAVGVPAENVGFSPAAFSEFADTSQGIVQNVTWVIS
ncbi:expansin-like protein [Gelatoporia subvermispora B]|uniref:Expansin-like protein n=1 Tax=Ceriporiopsis subvermispora (strain B) TaxID=914234 RepID=M2R4B1_CERS8|nr:expansin-like protein [Gelatoporia subvermispora B]